MRVTSMAKVTMSPPTLWLENSQADREGVQRFYNRPCGGLHTERPSRAPCAVHQMVNSAAVAPIHVVESECSPGCTLLLAS